MPESCGPSASAASTMTVTRAPVATMRMGMSHHGSACSAGGERGRGSSRQIMAMHTRPPPRRPATATAPVAQRAACTGSSGCQRRPGSGSKGGDRPRRHKASAQPGRRGRRPAMKADSTPPPARCRRRPPTPKSIPLSWTSTNSVGPVNHGRPIRMPPTVGPHQRAASDTAATSSGVMAILRRKSIGLSSRHLLRGPGCQAPCSCASETLGRPSP